MNCSFEINPDAFARAMINQVMTNWSRYVEKKKEEGVLLSPIANGE
jgi:hypothetical protein